MNVAIAGVKNVRNAQPVFFAGGADEAHNFGDLGARDDAVLSQEIRTEPPNGAEGALAAFPKIHSLLLGLCCSNFAGAICFANLDHAPSLFFEARGQAVEFDDQYRSGVEWKTKLISGFDGLGYELVHHFHRAGNDAGSDDIADGLAGIIDALEDAQHCLVSLRRPNEPDQDASNDAEHSFATDGGAAQIVAAGFFAPVGFGPEPDDLAIGQYHFKAEHVIGRDAKFERVRSAGVHGHIPTNGAGRLAGWVRRIKKPASFDSVGNPGIYASRFDQCAAVAIINLQDFVHPPQRDHHSAGDSEHRPT